MKANDCIQPAEHIKSISEYYFSAKLAEIAKMNAEGKNVVSLGVGSPDRPPSDETIDALCKTARQPDAHTYQPYTGIPQLRDAFAGWYKEWFAVDIEPQEILPLIGSKEGILHVSMAFLNAGDGVLVPNPGYPTYTSVSAMLQAKITQYDLMEENHWQPDFDALEKMDLSNVKLMWANYPNMPTGANATPGLFERLVAFGKKHNIVICHDNPYSLILNEKPLSILSVSGAKEICIELNSLSKSHNMPGWRMGMMASNEAFVKWVLKAKSNIDSGQFKPVQVAAIAALSNNREWHAGMNRLYAERRAWATKIMDALGCSYNKTQTGLFVWGKLSPEEKGSDAFANEILYNAGVFVTPGFIFGSNGERHIRISLGAPAEKLEEAFSRINEYMAQRHQQ